MDPQERQRRIAYAERQFAIHQAHVSYWSAMATTGAAKLRNISQGREPTPEEKEQGIVLPMRQLTDEEKTQQALLTMERHIRFMVDTNDYLDDLRKE